MENPSRFEITEIQTCSISGCKINPYHIYDGELGCWVEQTTQGSSDDFLGYKTEPEALGRVQELNAIANQVKPASPLNIEWVNASPRPLKLKSSTHPSLMPPTAGGI
jgi:hypothetical protein